MPANHQIWQIWFFLIWISVFDKMAPPLIWSKTTILFASSENLQNGYSAKFWPAFFEFIFTRLRINCHWNNIIEVEIFARTNFRALALCEYSTFSRVFFFAHLQISKKPDIWQCKRKIGVGFAKIYLGFIFTRKSVEIQYLC